MPYLDGVAEEREPDEQTSLINTSHHETENGKPSSGGTTSRLTGIVRWILRLLNPVVSRRPWRLFEICDLRFTPPFIRRCCQSMLTAQWTHRLPFIQQQSPAELAASLIIRTLDKYEDLEDTKFSVIDFCSGGGGPIPVIEKLVNAQRAARSQKPIPFLLTDIQPHLDAWIAASSRSAHLSFIPQPVDATDPPPAVISSASPAADPAARFSSGTRVFRLYCLAFHHFPDARAAATLASTLRTADGFAVVELQDRRLFSLAMMLADALLVLAVTAPWFWRRPLQMLFTYAVPVLPLVLSFDGFVSALRTRTFEEVVALVDQQGEGSKEGGSAVVSYGPDGESKFARRGGWVFEGGREMHTWPLGYMNWVVGRRLQ